MNQMGLFALVMVLGTRLELAALIVFTLTVMFSAWQRAVDRLPHLLDPSDSQPNLVALHDGLDAVQLFAIGAAVCNGYTCRWAAHAPIFTNVSYCVAAVLAWGVMRFNFWWRGTVGQPRMFGGESSADLRIGLWTGLQAATVGVAYGWAALTGRWIIEAPPVGEGFWSGIWAPALLVAVVAAPFFEEYVFRGLVFGGLRRSLGLRLSVLTSSLLFTLLHPSGSYPVIFILGVLLALIYERTGGLLAPIVAHSLYNLIIVGIQALS